MKTNLKNGLSNSLTSVTLVEKGMIMNYYETLPHFFAYFGLLLVLSGLFFSVYIAITPHREIKLIREGNTAVSIQLVGTFLGFVFPVSMVVAHSVNLVDVFLWGVIALFVQIITFKSLSLWFKAIEDRLVDNCISSGIFIGGISMAIGILQSVCMIP